MAGVDGETDRFCDSRNPQTLFWLRWHWHGLAPPADADDDARLHTDTTHGIQLKNCTKIITYVIIAVTKVCYCGQQASNTHGARQPTHELRTKCWMLWCSRLIQTNTKQTFARILWWQPHHSCAIADSRAPTLQCKFGGISFGFAPLESKHKHLVIKYTSLKRATKFSTYGKWSHSHISRDSKRQS